MTGDKAVTITTDRSMSSFSVAWLSSLGSTFHQALEVSVPSADVNVRTLGGEHRATIRVVLRGGRQWRKQTMRSPQRSRYLVISDRGVIPRTRPHLQLARPRPRAARRAEAVRPDLRIGRVSGLGGTAHMPKQPPTTLLIAPILLAP